MSKRELKEESPELMVTLSTGKRIPKGDFDKMKLTKQQKKMGMVGQMNRAMLRQKTKTRLTKPKKTEHAPDATRAKAAQKTARQVAKNRRVRKARKAAS